MIEDIEKALRAITNIDNLLITKNEINNSDYKKIILNNIDYYVYIPKSINYKVAYNIKYILENYLKYINRSNDIENSLSLLRDEIREIVKSYYYFADSQFVEENSFSFLEGKALYAIIKNDEVILNNGLDKHTIETSLLKLEKQGEFEINVKLGELYGFNTNYYKAIILSNFVIDDLQRSVIKLQLIFLNKLCENQIYLRKLEENNLNLENAYKEVKQAQAHLVQNEKMASLGMLVAGIAHEINNPMGAISSNVDLFTTIINRLIDSMSIQENKEIANLVSKLDVANNMNKIATERITEIIKSLKNFARLDEAIIKPANIHEGIENTLLLLKNKMKNNIAIVRQYGEIPEILCYPNQLNQVFMNLLVNAIHAIKDKGSILIKTYIQDEKVYIKINDTGSGIKPEHINKIFDPGFTTKGVGVGTGLGLSIVYNIIDKHKGRIWVKSEIDKGSEFTIELPINM